MLKHLLCVALILVCGSAIAQTKSDRDYDFVYQTANEILLVDRSSMKLTPGDAAVIATRACKTLERLLNETRFKDDIYSAANKSKKNAAESARLANDFRYFLSSFIPAENRILLAAGFTPEAASQLLLLAASLRDSLRQPLDPEKTMAAVAALRDGLCKAATTFANMKDDEASRSQTRKTIQWWAISLGGLALITVDAAAEAGTLGASTPVSVASIEIGAAVIINNATAQ